nr:MAG TPA: hypothetical protein [Bacteriophage sp.]
MEIEIFGMTKKRNRIIAITVDHEILVLEKMLANI